MAQAVYYCGCHGTNSCSWWIILDTKHHTLCSQPRLYLWWTPHVLDQVSSLSGSCYCHFHQLCYICPYITSTAACTRLQQIQNSLAHAVVKASKSCHTAPILCCSHWLKVTEHIECKLLSLAYKLLTTTQFFCTTSSLSASSQHTRFISCHSCWSTYIILVMNNWSFLSICFTVSLESTPLSTSSQSFYLWLSSFYACHVIFLCWLTALIICNSVTLSFPA